MTRSSSDRSRIVDVPSRRRCFGLLQLSKCRLPWRLRTTLPEAVILNRLATDFLVFWFLARRIALDLRRKTAKYRDAPHGVQALFWAKLAKVSCVMPPHRHIAPPRPSSTIPLIRPVPIRQPPVQGVSPTGAALFRGAPGPRSHDSSPRPITHSPPLPAPAMDPPHIFRVPR